MGRIRCDGFNRWVSGSKCGISERDARRLFGPGVDMAQVTAVAGRLNGKVQQLQAVINSMPLIDIM